MVRAGAGVSLALRQEAGASCSAVAGLRTWCRSPCVARSRAGGAGRGRLGGGAWTAAA